MPGFSTAALQAATATLVGAGGLGSHIACGLTRKGIGHLTIIDYDTCQQSNLSRQTYTREDIGKAKALCLAQHAAAAGCLGSRCIGHHVSFTAATAPRLLTGVTLCVCGVDNNETRRTASIWCRAQRIPCIHLAVNESADFGWLFIERVGNDQACVGCVFPRIANAHAGRQACRPVGAVLDILLLLAGLTLRAVDSLLMDRPCHWNYRDLHLAAGGTESLVPPRPGCPLCGGISA